MLWIQHFDTFKKGQEYARDMWQHLCRLEPLVLFLFCGDASFWCHCLNMLFKIGDEPEGGGKGYFEFCKAGQIARFNCQCAIDSKLFELKELRGDQLEFRPYLLPLMPKIMMGKKKGR